METRLVPLLVPLLVAGIVAQAAAQGQAAMDGLGASAAPRDVATSARAGAAGCPGQELYLHDFVGNIYRVEDYANNPTPILVANTGLGRMSDIAFDGQGQLLASRLAPFPLTEFYTHDANYTPSLLGSNHSMAWANALDVASDGTLWVRSANNGGLWTLDPATGQETPVVLMPRPTAGDLAIDPQGNLLAVDDLGRVDRYDPATGTVSVLGSHGLGPLAWGFEIDVDGTAYICMRNGDLYTLDLATMTPAFVGSTGIVVGGCAFLLPAEVRTPVGQGYCGPAVTNSTGAPATLAATGSASLAANDLRFAAHGLPPATVGVLLSSPSRGFVPMARGGQGVLCLAPRVRAHGDFAGTGTAGSACIALDLAMLPFQVGDTRHFQLWYRDSNPGATTNFTDALTITFE